MSTNRNEVEDSRRRSQQCLENIKNEFRKLKDDILIDREKYLSAVEDLRRAVSNVEKESIILNKNLIDAKEKLDRHRMRMDRL